MIRVGTVFPAKAASRQSSGHGLPSRPGNVQTCMEGHDFDYAFPLVIAAVVGCGVVLAFCLAGHKTISTLSQSSNLLVAGAIMVFGVASVLGLSAYSGDMLNITVWLRAVGEIVREL
jgi:hypothetical protein